MRCALCFETLRLTGYLLGDELLDGLLGDVGVGGAYHEGDRDLAGGVILLPAMRVHNPVRPSNYSDGFLWFQRKGNGGLTGRRLRRRWKGERGAATPAQ